MHPNGCWTHGTHGTSDTSIFLRVHICCSGVYTSTQTDLPVPALTSCNPQPQPAALHARLRHIARLRTTHARSMSTGTTQAGRAGKARKQSARMQAAWGCANAQGGGHYMRARQGYGSPCARWRLVRELEHGSSDDEQESGCIICTCESMWQHAWVGERDDTYVAGDDTLRTDMQ